MPVNDIEAGCGVASEGGGGGQDGSGSAQDGAVGECAGGEGDVTVRSLVIVVSDRDAAAGPEGPHVPCRLGPRAVGSPAFLQAGRGQFLDLVPADAACRLVGGFNAYACPTER